MKALLLLSYLTILPAGETPLDRDWKVEGELRFECFGPDFSDDIFYLQLRGDRQKNYLIVTQRKWAEGQPTSRRVLFQNVDSETEFVDQSLLPTKISFFHRGSIGLGANTTSDSNGGTFQFSFVWQDEAIFSAIYERPRFLINLPEGPVETECSWDRNSGNSQ